MSSRNLLNLFLLVFIAGLVTVVIYEPGLPPEPTRPKITSLTQDYIKHIYIKRDTDLDVELEKVNGVWQMLNPYPLPAHDFRVQTILRLAEAESYSQHELSGLNKKTFGLDKPKATVTFNKQQQILFGANEPLQQRRYIQVGNTLHTIIDTFYYQVASQVSTFIDHALLAGDSAITRLELPELVVELQDGKWHANPQPENFSADSITELLNNWRNTQAIEISRADKTETKQAITIYLKDQQPVRFAIIKNETGIALVRNDIGIAYNISPDSFDKLTKLPVINQAEKDPE